MDIVNACKILELYHGTLTFLSTVALPPPVLDCNLEVLHIAFLAYTVKFISSIRPPPHAVPQFKYRMNLFHPQPVVYHGYNVFQVIVKSPERF